ncbi:Flp pilus assembly protein CpaB [Vibrio sp. HA2012]|uniref:Flp pilus assembly protein CpaB n=1 Tax=Vibrio sp. HA2012 TaxID=1971595 RepID=UPI000C2CC9AD|nr:Flp pilus assembly protein CpaB [Vibrio sp. HA2012]PJC86099.1 Flp pilus assembly protein CpaB [Vibrio sp. HA2012]
MNLKILLPIAVIAMGAGLYGLSGSLDTQENSPAVTEAAPKQLRIWLTNTALQPGQVVTSRELETRLVPEAEANKHGLVSDTSIQFVKGMVAGLALESGQWVTNSDFVTPDKPEYIELTTAKGMVPYAIKVEPETMIGGVIGQGSLVDIVALSSTDQNLANENTVRGYQSVSVSPVLMAVKVLQVQKHTPTEIEKATSKTVSNDVTMVLELSRKQLAKLVVARKIAQLEVHKSVGSAEAEQLHANAGDVLPSYQAIKEFRAGETSIR